MSSALPSRRAPRFRPFSASRDRQPRLASSNSSLRAKATLHRLATFGEKNQVLLFTHHERVRDAAAARADRHRGPRFLSA
jgi:hypothetical protein